MYEKVNPSHPDKVADRIAGAIVDLAYERQQNPKIAVEVLIGHGVANIICESSVLISSVDAQEIVSRIAGTDVLARLVCKPQDPHLADNQEDEIRCGDNGIFKGVPTTREQDALSSIAFQLYKEYPTDGKFIIDGQRLIICQSNAKKEDLSKYMAEKHPTFWTTINPIGDWTGGTNVDSGATNRKLGSDMGDAVTGGGLHGKDLSKADVSVNIWCHLQAQKLGHEVTACCAIGDTEVNGVPYSQIVGEAYEYIKQVGGFEKFAEWGLV